MDLVNQWGQDNTEAKSDHAGTNMHAYTCVSRAPEATSIITSTSPPARDAEAFSAVHGIFLHESHMQFQNKISASDSTIISTLF